MRGADARRTRLVCAHRDRERLCLYGLEVLVEAGADDALDADGCEAEVAVKGKVAGASVALGGGEEELDHGGAGRRGRRSQRGGGGWVLGHDGAGAVGDVGDDWDEGGSVGRGESEKGGGGDMARKGSCGCISLYGEKME